MAWMAWIVWIVWMVWMVFFILNISILNLESCDLYLKSKYRYIECLDLIFGFEILVVR
jgi:hypothetical protein